MNKNRCPLQGDNSTNIIITDTSELLRNAGFEDNYIGLFTDSVVRVLNDYTVLLGKGTEIEYRLKKKFTKIEISIFIPGEPLDPFTSGSEAERRKIESITSLNLNIELPHISYKYMRNCNVISISVPLSERRKSLFENPLFLAIILGIVAGLVCQQLPESVNSFIIDDIAEPLKDIILGIITGIMGPVIFISLITSVITLESINDLTNLGFKIAKRFFVIILFYIVLSLLVSSFFFNSFGTAIMSFSTDDMIQMVLGIIPTNLINPFVEGNTAQILILGLLMGSALLLLGDRVTGLNDLLLQIYEWIMSAMKIVLMITPVIPFLSLLTTIGSGNFSTILKGWKFVVVVYIVVTIAAVAKVIKTSLVTGIHVRDLWNKLKPIVMITFMTSASAAGKKIYEVSDEELNINPKFTSFWYPICYSMLGTKTTVYLIPATLMAAQLSGIRITASFIFVLILVTLELSLASPGSTSAWTTMFSILGISTDYVGIFTIYKLFTDNYSSAAVVAYSMFEEVEAAHKLGGMKEGSL